MIIIWLTLTIIVLEHVANRRREKTRAQHHKIRVHCAGVMRRYMMIEKSGLEDRWRVVMMLRYLALVSAAFRFDLLVNVILFCKYRNHNNRVWSGPYLDILYLR